MVASRSRSRWDAPPPTEETSGENGTAGSTATQESPTVSAAPDSTHSTSVKPTRKRARWDQPPTIDANQQQNIISDHEPVNVSPMHSVKRSRWDAPPSQSTDTPIVTITPTEQHTQDTNNLRRTGITNGDDNNNDNNDDNDNDDQDGGFVMHAESAATVGGAVAPETYGVPRGIPGVGGLQFLKAEDMMHFSKLMSTADDSTLSPTELKERRILKLLLHIKNGTAAVRRVAMRTIVERARVFGPALLFNQTLPLLMSPSLDDQERHLLVKVVGRVLLRLGELVQPFVHKILVVIEPLLIDDSHYARLEGREIIANLAKAAGLPAMLSVMRDDIDHEDDSVRNTTAKALAVVTAALGVQQLENFLAAVCTSTKSWQTRHTGIMVIQQLTSLLGAGVLPHLQTLVDIVAHGLTDEQPKIRSLTAITLAHLAECSAPYGIDSFEPVLDPLWQGTRHHRGRALASFLRAIGFIIPLMTAENANIYTRQLITVLTREFQTSDEEMRRTILMVVKQFASTEGITPAFLKEEVFPDFFKYFWTRRLAIDKNASKQVVETTSAFARNAGVSSVLSQIVHFLKDENESFRSMTAQTISDIVSIGGMMDVDNRLELTLVNGMLFAFHDQSPDGDNVILDGLGVLINSLGTRTEAYLEEIVATILWRLNHKESKVRQQAAELVSRIAKVIAECKGDKILSQLGSVLYENLGEEYPDALATILAALKSIVEVVGANDMSPAIGELLPRLTPILRNRHERVQENCIDIVGTIADKGPEFVTVKEWMRICFELLDLLKAHRRGIRRAAVSTIGSISRAIGPHDVLATLLNNLKVQERQNRVCTTVAIAIVADNCAPFTVLPALMNEYRVPELNVQNGVLKSLSFLFEYIGAMAKDYVYAITPLLVDALTDRDIVHRQTACMAVKHLSIGVAGHGCEDALIHLLNHVWPNIFETAPHMERAVMESLEGLRLALGAGQMLMYLLSGLFHPAKRVREVYWRIYNVLYLRSQDSLVAFYPTLYNKEIIEPETEREVRGDPLQYVCYELDTIF